MEEENKRILYLSSDQEGCKPLRPVGRDQAMGKYDIAELFSPVRMIGMAEEFGLRGGWSVDDWCTDPITGRTYDLRSRNVRTRSGR